MRRHLTLACALLAAASTGCTSDSGSEDAGSMQVVQVVRDLLAETPEPEDVRAHPNFKPRVDVITPAWHFSIDGADMPALEMPPPCEISFRLAADAPPSVLRARAGADVSIFKLLSENQTEATFEFEVLLDGESAFKERITLKKGKKPPGSEWLDVGGAAGVPVRPGQLLTLRTTLFDAAGQPVEPPVRMPVGFGRLRLERSLPVARRTSSRAAPNLILIVMDTLRVDRLSAYGYERPTSPHLEALAARGSLFENAYATSSWTWPSTASILTGLHPQEHGVVNAGACYLGQDLLTLAEALQPTGITTGAWTGNPLLTASRNFDQGFETFGATRVDFRKTGTFFDEMSAWVEEQAGRRFFLYVQMTEPHHPFEPLSEGKRLFAPEVPEGFGERMTKIKAELRTGEGVAADGTLALDAIVSPEERRWSSDMYDALVWSGDYWLGQVVALLERLELDDETLIVFTSDHGEEIFERGFFNHGQNIYPELVRSPLVMAGPGIPVGRRFTQPVSNRLVADYLASRAGTDLARPFDPALFFSGGGEKADTPVLFSTEKGFWNGLREQRIYGLRSGSLSLQFDPEADGLRLYDVSVDRKERNDLVNERADEALRLRGELLGLLQSLDLRATEDRRVGAETLRLLEDIGYMGEED